MTSRLFVSFDIPGEIKNEICEICDSIITSSKDYRWEKKEKLHFTLKFLGDVDNHKINSITEKLEEISSITKSISCEFKNFGLFYKSKIPKILWLGLKENIELINLRSKIENELSYIGYEKEQRLFKPHLTLLRIKEYYDCKVLEKFNGLHYSGSNFIGDQITLMKSELLKSGSVYKPIKSFKLL